MKRVLFVTIAALSCASLLLAAGGASKITGSYVEVRSADVWVGACYANSEAGMLGKEGSMAWNIQNGEFNGVSLKGLSVVAAVLANSTIGDKHTNYFPIRSVLLLDSRATERQREALRGFARASAGKMLGTVVREEIVPITFEQTHCALTGHEEHTDANGHIAACTKVTAGSILTLQTRNLLHTDAVCANAERFYDPMIKGVKNETPVFAPQMSFAGQGLGANWSIPNRRGGFVANFELTAPLTENQ